ncbi:hypothetical protein LPJ78_001859 [Coemansia sp. RSA 989]|nr:hypothetical protein LPJ68_002025 [Coemansia sp. RSA 1086]KAJ1751696.1 hypothetical protein LPJ79_001860 [Coemansia sp. RSA 1821]KAJ1866394.1 hypothetical protein LPJ78_001859 [Coemansia sp. RSA 989]KAJ1872953.1 hypothetical protein LPJ55_002667 [Coemansia sp. RSA 990]KAJ2674479.1 hypothetical protein IWW42_001649 [Coemansia sp. RSA 1085]
MNGAKSVLCSYFDTPEGRWSLVSEFATEEAANQFTPHIAAKACGDDLSLGASGTELPPAPATATVSTARFGASSTMMASGGLMFSSDTTPSSANTSTTTVNTANGVSRSGQMRAVANRPTLVMVLRPFGDGDKGQLAISGSNASESTSQSGGRSLGFRQGILNLKSNNGNNTAQQAQPSQQQSKPHGKGLVTKSTSAFVSRIITNENLARWIVDIQTTYLLFNAPKCFNLMGVQLDNYGETLARLDFASNTPLCYDVNQMTRSESRLDVIMGFVQGNLIWYDPISGKYARLNKNSGYNQAAAMCIKWLPHSDNLFMVGMSDGAIMIMDRTKEEFCVPLLAHTGRVDSMDAFETACPQKPKCNPVSFWKVSNRAITSIEFSPDSQRVCVTSEDGGLRIIDYLNEILEDVYLSYFGGLSCCAWSGDGKYVVAGGKDDLITVWSYYDQSIVARCQGHESWVRSIVFDPAESDSTYRFLSVGDDGKLLMWDFSLSALHRPRGPIHRAATGVSNASMPQSAANSTMGLSAGLSRGVGDALHLPGRPEIREIQPGVVHCRAPQGAVAVLQPLVSEVIHDAPLCSLHLCQDLLATACRRGTVKVWKRPKSFDLSAFV